MIQIKEWMKNQNTIREDQIQYTIPEIVEDKNDIQYKIEDLRNVLKVDLCGSLDLVVDQLLEVREKRYMKSSKMIQAILNDNEIVTDSSQKYTEAQLKFMKSNKRIKKQMRKVNMQFIPNVPLENIDTIECPNSIMTHFCGVEAPKLEQKEQYRGHSHRNIGRELDFQKILTELKLEQPIRKLVYKCMTKNGCFQFGEQKIEPIIEQNLTKEQFDLIKEANNIIKNEGLA